MDSPSDIPGSAADARAHAAWEEKVFAKHKFTRFGPPSCSCKCGEYIQAPKDMGIIRQRDYLLDRFIEHRRFMSSEKLRLTRLARAAGDE